MSLISKIQSLVIGVAAEFKALRRDLGNPTALTTMAQSNLVAAINEVRALIDATPGLNLINDANPNATATTLSAAGILSRLEQLKSDILGGADGAFDTLKELQEALASDTSGIAALSQAIDARLRCDADQGLTVTAQTQARVNIRAISVDEVGDTETDFVVGFRDALAA